MALWLHVSVGVALEGLGVEAVDGSGGRKNFRDSCGGELLLLSSESAPESCACNGGVEGEMMAASSSSVLGAAMRGLGDRTTGGAEAEAGRPDACCCHKGELSEKEEELPVL